MSLKKLASYLFFAVSPTTMISNEFHKKTVNEPVLPADAPVVILFFHGLGGSSDDVDYYIQHAQLPFSFVAADFPCSTKKCSNPYAVTCLAQEKEQQTVIDLYLQVVRQGKRVIFWGLSNGASTLVTTLGCYHLANVVAAIVESPYADPKTWLKNNNRDLAPSYNFKGACPLDVVQLIDPALPILFVHSKKDSVVSYKETQKLYRRLRNAGHSNAQELCLQQGEHANFFTKPQGKVYCNGVHQFLVEASVIGSH